jgi:fructose-specific phosphotransferase system IIC component
MTPFVSKMLPIVVGNTLIVAMAWYAMEPPRLNWALLFLWLAANLVGLATVRHHLAKKHGG